MKKGFTLIEMLVVVLIVGILSSVALPTYKKSIEKTHATEAMNIVKAANEAVYAYAAERNKCPDDFKKILISIPGEQLGVAVKGKHFMYHLNASTSALIPGTSCGGVVAERIKAGNYVIWNPYATMADSGKRTLACTATSKVGISACKALGLYTTNTP